MLLGLPMLPRSAPTSGPYPTRTQQQQRLDLLEQQVANLIESTRLEAVVELQSAMIAQLQAQLNLLDLPQRVPCPVAPQRNHEGTHYCVNNRGVIEWVPISRTVSSAYTFAHESIPA